MKKRTIIQLIPLLVATLLTLFGIGQVFTTPDVIDPSGNIQSAAITNGAIGASIGLVVVFILLFARKAIWKLVFAVLIVLAIAQLRA